MEDLTLSLIGLYAVYSIIHLGFLQTKAWVIRSGYEKVVTVFALVFTFLLFLGSMSN